MKGTINILQYGRAVAALVVVLHHSLLETTAFSGLPPRWVEVIGSHGYLGVDFFFVLSGFIIMHAHMDDARGALAAIRYMTKRMRRIYIPYLPVSIGMIVLYQALPSVSAANRDWGLITSLFLFPTEHPPALSVAWTLVHEMTFYSLFLASYFTRHFAVVICAWAGGIVAAWAAGWVPPTALLRVLLAPINLEFVAGMGAALLVCRVDSSWWPAFFFAGLCSAIVCLWSGVDETTRVWFGLSLALVVVGLVFIERLGGPLFPVGLILGNASYAIYLVHNPLASFAARATMSLHQWQITLAVCVLAGTLGGIAYHYIVEMPAIARTKSFFARRMPLT
jgi:exopolysaccharide production protein ExoZ